MLTREILEGLGQNYFLGDSTLVEITFHGVRYNPLTKEKNYNKTFLKNVVTVTQL